jgi:hypothetical protein
MVPVASLFQCIFVNIDMLLLLLLLLLLCSPVCPLSQLDDFMAAVARNAAHGTHACLGNMLVWFPIHLRASAIHSC